MRLANQLTTGVPTSGLALIARPTPSSACTRCRTDSWANAASADLCANVSGHQLPRTLNLRKAFLPPPDEIEKLVSRLGGFHLRYVSRCNAAEILPEIPSRPVPARPPFALPECDLFGGRGTGIERLLDEVAGGYAHEEFKRTRR